MTLSPSSRSTAPRPFAVCEAPPAEVRTRSFTSAVSSSAVLS
ncbi:hypothetical protein ACFQ7M_18140 [Streptomyces massasporeus]